ncbi:MAG: acyl carrier protein [Flavobacteriales bacterium]|nr:acyl carrier protein [Flavobacteriales bacterium]
MAQLRERLLPRAARIGLTANDLTPDLDLVRSGLLDSLAFVDLIANMEQELGVQVDLEQALAAGRITTISAVVGLFLHHER